MIAHYRATGKTLARFWNHLEMLDIDVDVAVSRYRQGERGYCCWR